MLSLAESLRTFNQRLKKLNDSQEDYSYMVLNENKNNQNKVDWLKRDSSNLIGFKNPLIMNL